MYYIDICKKLQNYRIALLNLFCKLLTFTGWFHYLQIL